MHGVTARAVCFLYRAGSWYFLTKFASFRPMACFLRMRKAMDTIAHAAERWEFRCDRAASGWQWRRRARDGGIIACSTRNLPSLDEAVCDAVESGFAYMHAARNA